MVYPTEAKCLECGRQMKVTKNTFTEGPERRVTLETVEYKCICGNEFYNPLYLRQEARNG